jgi:hypothetical protein
LIFLALIPTSLPLASRPIVPRAERDGIADAIAVRPRPEPAKPELEGLTRRQVLGSFGIMLAGVALLRLAPQAVPSEVGKKCPASSERT